MKIKKNLISFKKTDENLLKMKIKWPNENLFFNKCKMLTTEWLNLLLPSSTN